MGVGPSGFLERMDHNSGLNSGLDLQCRDGVAARTIRWLVFGYPEAKTKFKTST
jgi:hypothetical protein